jgi:ABC-type bacteriocin/lantibiotic exporter with double-glycine peptidase domain
MSMASRVAGSLTALPTPISRRKATSAMVMACPLSRISLHIASGRFVAIVGPNGSGKSTLAQILAGVLPPASGKSRDCRGRCCDDPLGRTSSLYSLCAAVHPVCSTGRCGENILYPPTNQQISDVEELLHVWRFHGRKTDRLRYELGEQGERLSGGQIQKLELARLAGVDVPVLILDESTSALDPRSEADVIEGYGADQ